MKKYIQSFRVFFGATQLKSLVIFSAVIFGFMILCGAASFLSENDFITGFAQGVSSMIGTLAAVFGLMFLNALYQSLSPSVPGYKYYRSLPDGAAHFRRAITAGNILGIAAGLVLLALVSVVYVLIGVEQTFTLFGIALLFAAAGVCNFTGYIRVNTARIISLMALMCVFGFALGFMDGSGEEEGLSAMQLLSQNSGVFLMIVGGSIALFIAGLIYALALAEKKWGDAR